MSSTPILTFEQDRVSPIKGHAHSDAIALAPSIGSVAAGSLVGQLSGSLGQYKPYVKGASLTPTNDVQTLTITATGGTYQLEFNGETSANLAYNANAAAIQAALLALPNVPASGFAVTGSGPYVITAGGTLAGQLLTLIAIVDTGLTGGSASIAHTTPGSTGAATDGSQIPVYILEYACYVDGSGNITFGTGITQTGGEWGQSYLTAPAYKGGEFSIADIPNLDANVLAVWPGARVLEGSIGSGAGRMLFPV